jgi:hypothetical protein
MESQIRNEMNEIMSDKIYTDANEMIEYIEKPVNIDDIPCEDTLVDDKTTYEITMNVGNVFYRMNNFLMEKMNRYIALRRENPHIKTDNVGITKNLFRVFLLKDGVSKDVISYTKESLLRAFKDKIYGRLGENHEKKLPIDDLSIKLIAYVKTEKPGISKSIKDAIRKKYDTIHTKERSESKITSSSDVKTKPESKSKSKSESKPKPKSKSNPKSKSKSKPKSKSKSKPESKSKSKSKSKPESKSKPKSKSKSKSKSKTKSKSKSKSKPKPKSKSKSKPKSKSESKPKSKSKSKFKTKSKSNTKSKPKPKSKSKSKPDPKSKIVDKRSNKNKRIKFAIEQEKMCNKLLDIYNIQQENMNNSSKTIWWKDVTDDMQEKIMNLLDDDQGGKCSDIFSTKNWSVYNENTVSKYKSLTKSILCACNYNITSALINDKTTCDRGGIIIEKNARK